MDHVAAPRAAECARVHITAVGCPGTAAVLNTIRAWKGPDANRKTHQDGACDADANAATHGDTDAKAATHTDTHACDNTITNTNPDANTSPNADTHPGPNTNPDSSAPDL